MRALRIRSRESTPNDDVEFFGLLEEITPKSEFHFMNQPLMGITAPHKAVLRIYRKLLIQ